MAAGQRYGRLVAIKPDGPRRWQFACDCGRGVVIETYSARSGHTKSCGCFRTETAAAQAQVNATHGKTKTPEYYSWKSAMARCSNPNLTEYPDYGGRGIKVCERWRIFENFLADMGERPSRHHTLDRHPDKNGDYEPGNCRWATKAEQSRNQRSNKIVDYRGRQMSVAEACDLAGVRESMVGQRLRKGWTFERAISTPRRGAKAVSR